MSDDNEMKDYIMIRVLKEEKKELKEKERKKGNQI